MPQVARNEFPGICAARPDPVVERLGVAAAYESAVTSTFRRDTRCMAMAADGRTRSTSPRPHLSPRRIGSQHRLVEPAYRFVGRFEFRIRLDERPPNARKLTLIDRRIL